MMAEGACPCTTEALDAPMYDVRGTMYDLEIMRSGAAGKRSRCERNVVKLCVDDGRGGLPMYDGGA